MITSINREDMSDIEILQTDLEEANKKIKDLQKEKRDLTAKLKHKSAERTYWQDMYKDRCRHEQHLINRIEQLQSDVKQAKEEGERGYKQRNTYDKKHSGIYRIYNINTGENYVGQSSISVRDRCMSHFYECTASSDDWHYDVYHHPENYKYEILVEGVPNQGVLDRLEIYYIGKYNGLEHGYNNVLAARYKFLENFI